MGHYGEERKNMKAELLKELETLRGRLAELEKTEEQERKAQRENEERAIAERAVFEVVVQDTEPHWATIVDTTEVFTVRLVPKEMFNGDNGRSIGYIISRKHRKIIGYEGGGCVWIQRENDRHNFGGTDPNTPWNIMARKAQETMDAYLAGLPELT